MGLRSSVALLPPDIREWLESELLSRNFSGYLDLTEDLNERLAEHGLEVTISKTSLFRYSKQFEEKVDALKRTTETARTIVRELGDDEGAMNDAVIRLVQDRLFSTVLDEELSTKSLAAIAKAVSDLGRASVMQKKWAAEYRAKTEAAAENVAAIAKKGGLSAEAVDQLRREILGIAA